MIDTTIRNPDNDDHFARIKPAGRRVRVLRGDAVLADSSAASRLIENGRDLYDPVFYIPASDVTAELDPVSGKSTHCPLKGDAAYLSHLGEEIAWTYDRPLAGSSVLEGLVAFYADKVVIEEIGSHA